MNACTARYAGGDDAGSVAISMLSMLSSSVLLAGLV